MRHCGGNILVDQATATETREGEGCRNGVWFILRNCVREYVTGARGRLEPAGTPAAIEIQALDRGLCDKRARIRSNIDNATPASHHAYTAEDRE